MATIRKLRGRWQAQVRRRGVAPRAKSFNTKADAQRWAQDLEAEANRSGWAADTRAAEKTTLQELLTRYCAEVTPIGWPCVKAPDFRNSAKLRRTQCEQMSSGLPLKADIAQYSRLVSKVPKSEVGHSITSSVWASSVSGTVRPSAFAVLRLMTTRERQSRACLLQDFF
jgi:hypothetical protein